MVYVCRQFDFQAGSPFTLHDELNCIEYQNGCSPNELGIRNHFAYATEELNNFRLLLTKMTVVQSSAPIPELDHLTGILKTQVQILAGSQYIFV